VSTARAAAALLALALGCAPAPPIAETRTSQPAASEDPVVRELAERVNAHRRRLGRPPLQWDARVATVALRHSRNMVERDFFSHQDSQGRSPFDRLDAAGIRFSKAAENIASGQRDAASVLDSWLSSAGHRENLEDPDFTRHGIGRFANHWTHVFIRPPRIRPD